MATFNFFLYVFYIISMCQIINNTLALNKEAIVGGTIANKGVFTYQAAIVGRQNYSTKFQLLCGAGILDDKFVLTSARCFFNTAGKLKKISFQVIVADLMLEQGTKFDIDIVYLIGLKDASKLSDLAVVKLKESLHLSYNVHLKKLELPDNRKFRRTVFLVSGYGASKIKTAIDPVTRIERRTSYRADWLLRFGVVKTVSKIYCKDLFPSPDLDKELCGIILPRNFSEPEGLCMSDNGNPLVSGKTIIGILSKSSKNCDNRFSGALYTKVSSYVTFIQAILQGKLDEVSSIIHAFKNPKHIR